MRLAFQDLTHGKDDKKLRARIDAKVLLTRIQVSVGPTGDALISNEKPHLSACGHSREFLVRPCKFSIKR